MRVAGGNLAIVGDGRVGAGLHAVAGVATNQSARAVDDRGRDTGTAQCIQVQALPGGGADDAAVIDQQAAADEVAVDAQRVVEPQNLPASAVVNAVVARLSQVAAAVDRPATGRNDFPRVINHHTGTGRAVLEADSLAGIGNAARRGNRQGIGPAQGLRGGGGGVDLHGFVRRRTGPRTDQKGDDDGQTLG
ncbi:hypothetical protein D3C87_1563590 [compost metagenome]